MLRVDALHSRAHADGAGHELHDLAFVRDFLGQTLDQVQLGADEPVRARRGRPHRAQDVLGRADMVRGLADLVGILRMADHDAVRHLAPEFLDLRRTIDRL